MWSSPLDGSIRMIHQYSIPGMSFGFLSTPVVKHTQQASNIYLYSHLPGQERHRKESRTKQQCEKRGNGNTMKIHKKTQGSSFSNWTTNSVRSPTYYITLCYIIRFFFVLNIKSSGNRNFLKLKRIKITNYRLPVFVSVWRLDKYI